LASRGKFVGKSIPVSTSKGHGGKGAKGAKATNPTKAGRSRRTQPTKASTSTPALAPTPALRSPPNGVHDDQDHLIQPETLDPPKCPIKGISIDPQSVNDASFLGDTLVDLQLSVEMETTLEMPSSDISTYLDMNNRLYPRIDVLNIPDELKFIMQYR
jgi:hypothetical protein